MSIVRWGSDGSDVYVYEGSDGMECCDCCLSPDHHFATRNADEFIVHIAAHRAAGHCVPSYVDAEVRERMT